MAEDLRTKRTKMFIEKAFVDLVNQKGFVNVTVKEIAQEAMINRQTFYNYYTDKYDLTHKLNEKYINIIKDALDKRLQLKNSIKFEDFISSEIISMLLDSKNSLNALRSIKFDQESFEDLIEQVLGEFYFTYFYNGEIPLGMSMDSYEVISFRHLLVGIIEACLKYGNTPDIETIKHFRKQLVEFLP